MNIKGSTKTHAPRKLDKRIRGYTASLCNRMFRPTNIVEFTESPVTCVLCLRRLNKNETMA